MRYLILLALLGACGDSYEEKSKKQEEEYERQQLAERLHMMCQSFAANMSKPFMLERQAICKRETEKNNKEEKRIKSYLPKKDQEKVHVMIRMVPECFPQGFPEEDETSYYRFCTEYIGDIAEQARKSK